MKVLIAFVLLLVVVVLLFFAQKHERFEQHAIVIRQASQSEFVSASEVVAEEALLEISSEFKNKFKIKIKTNKKLFIAVLSNNTLNIHNIHKVGYRNQFDVPYVSLLNSVFDTDIVADADHKEVVLVTFSDGMELSRICGDLNATPVDLSKIEWTRLKVLSKTLETDMFTVNNNQYTCLASDVCILQRSSPTSQVVQKYDWAVTRAVPKCIDVDTSKGEYYSYDKRVTLMGTNFVGMDGTYHITRQDPGRTTLCEALVADSVKCELSKTAGNTVTGRNVDSFDVDDIVYFSDLQWYVKVVDATDSGAFTATVVQKLAGYDEMYDSFNCYEDPTVINRNVCEVMGLHWDRMCKFDSECPFFNANTNYPNLRGGCNSGMCEMPIGVRRVSYKAFDQTSRPMCYGCDDPADAFCCNDQAKPDYAFFNDALERKTNYLVNSQ